MGGTNKVGSSAGTQLKCTKGDWYIKYDNFGRNEGLAEVITSRFIDTCIIPMKHIKYIPYHDERGVGCASRINKDMLCDSCSLMHYMEYKYGVLWGNRYDYTTPEAFYRGLIHDLADIVDAAEYFTYLQLFDTIVCNTDRHFSIFNLVGLSNGQLRFSPLYDFGASLGCAAFHDETVHMCCTVLGSRCCWLPMLRHEAALSLVSSYHPYKLSFKQDIIKVSDLYELYPVGLVLRAVEIIEYNLSKLGFDMKFRCI